jgi:hypothetical protein
MFSLPSRTMLWWSLLRSPLSYQCHQPSDFEELLAWWMFKLPPTPSYAVILQVGPWLGKQGCGVLFKYLQDCLLAETGSMLGHIPLTSTKALQEFFDYFTRLLTCSFPSPGGSTKCDTTYTPVGSIFSTGPARTLSTHQRSYLILQLHLEEAFRLRSELQITNSSSRCQMYRV